MYVYEGIIFYKVVLQWHWVTSWKVYFVIILTLFYFAFQRFWGFGSKKDFLRAEIEKASSKSRIEQHTNCTATIHSGNRWTAIWLSQHKKWLVTHKKNFFWSQSHHQHLLNTTTKVTKHCNLLKRLASNHWEANFTTLLNSTYCCMFFLLWNTVVQYGIKSTTPKKLTDFIWVP